MQRASRSTALSFLLLAGLAGAAALVSNALAPPARRLTWRVSPAMAPTRHTASIAPVPQAQPVQPEAKAPTRAVHPGTAAPVSPPPATAPPIAGPQEAAPSNPIREVGGTEVWRAFQAGAPFLDARRSAEYLAGHIAGAWCVPVWESDLDDRLIAFKAARHPGSEDPIVIYCSGGDCRDSHLLAAKLLEDGYFHLLIYRDGYPDWLGQNRPVEKGQP